MHNTDSEPQTQQNSASYENNRSLQTPQTEKPIKKRKHLNKNKDIKTASKQNITSTSLQQQDKTGTNNVKKQRPLSKRTSNKSPQIQLSNKPQQLAAKSQMHEKLRQQNEKLTKRLQQLEPILKQMSGSKKKDKKKSNLIRQEYRVCEHVSVFNKILIAFVLTAVYVVFLRPLPKISYPVAEYGEEVHDKVLEIVTDRITVALRFPIQISQPIFEILPIQSTKTARIKASINCTIGYKFESISTTPSSQHIQMSDLQILSYSISQVSLFNKEDGIFNTWEFADHQKLLSYIKDHYVEDLKKQALNSISEEKKEIYANRAEVLFRGLHEQYQGWLDWIIGRISMYVDFGLQPYVKKVQLLYAKNAIEEAKNYS